MSKLLKNVVFVLLAAAASGLPLAAQSQEVSAAANQQELEEIIVTGSRLSNPNFTAPTPVQVLSAETIEQRAPAAIADVVNEIPAFRITRSASGSGRIADQQSGVQALLDLRGLEALRTLVLIDGKRTVGTVQQGTFDTNMIPVGLIERVDVVTGGASAAYGSDAVAGVVNFVLNRNLQGFRASLQTGATRYSDGRQTMGTLAGGFGFGDGRGQLIFGLDAAKSDGVGNMYTRPYGRNEPGILALTAAQRTALGLQAQVFANNVELANVTPGGLIQGLTTGGLRYGFDAAGSPVLFNQTASLFGTGTAAVMVGSNANYGNNPNGAFKLQNENDRQAFYSRVQYELNPDLTVYAEGNYGRSRLPRQLTGFYTTTFQVPRTSLPASIAGLYTGTNVTIGRMMTEQGGGNMTWQTNSLTRFVVGAEGNVFGDWRWDVSYEHSRDHQDFNTSGLVLSALFRAVYNCAGTTATNPNLTTALVAQLTAYESLTGKTCSPFSPFGVQSDSSAAVNYLYTTQHQDSYFGQDSAAVALSGTPFALWAGDVSLAAGLEWRRNTLEVVGTALGTNSVFSQGNFGYYQGTNSVKEGFAEIGIPLLRDKSLARSLDLNAAIRRTDYELSGAVTTWKEGLTYEPIDGLRFRVTQSRDIRAPNLGELFFVGGALPGALTNNMPGTFGFGVTSQSITSGRGNPNLVPEKADTFTTGIVVQPTGGLLQGFRAAVDYYKIKVNGAIVRPNSAQSQNICAALIGAGQTSCPGFVFNNTPGTNGITSQANLSQNLNALKVEGIDFELAYKLRGLPMNLPGSLEMRALVNHALHDQQVLSTGTFELAGSMNGVPDWNANLTLAYDNGRFGAEYQITGFTGVKYDTTTLFLASATQTATGLATDPTDPGYVLANNSSISANHFGGVAYSNLSGHFKVTDAVEVFAVVNNLFDRKPPEFVAIAVTNGGRNLNYDLLGQSYKIGVRARF